MSTDMDSGASDEPDGQPDEWSNAEKEAAAKVERRCGISLGAPDEN